MSLSEQAFSVLSQNFSQIEKKSSRPMIWGIESNKCNVRTASKKSGDKYWFDVTPALYEENQVDYFIYVCGSPESIYIFPCDDFAELIKGAHLGGQKQVPNFTIFDGVNEFEPAGLSNKRKNIFKYRNNFKTISDTNKKSPNFQFSYPDEVSKDAIEGAKKTITVNSYERSIEARQRCIQHFGYKCSVCGFDFLASYGDRGRQFIHVHHLVPISTIGESYVVDPITDLRPICPNCHAMVHRTDPPCSIEELKQIMKKI